MESYEVVGKYDEALCLEAARLHHEILSYRSFITAFGAGFLKEIYRDILEDGQGLIAAFKDGEQVRGFVLGCFSTGAMFAAVKRHFVKYFLMMVPLCLRNPRLIARILETLSYVRRESCDVEAELVVMAVDARYRSRGIGKELLRLLEKELLRRNICQYKVTVHDEMERSRHFYQQNGFCLRNQFAMYGVMWDLYTKDIGLR